MSTNLLDSGYAALRRGDPEVALSYFQCAIDQNPDHPQAYFAAAMAYLEQEKTEEAMQSLRDALSVDPAYASARAYIGILLLGLYDADGAQSELEQALHDDPTNLLVHIKYAEFYYRLGFFPRAVVLLERGLKAPHRANEHVVAMARSLLTQSRQKSKNIIVRDPPDPRAIFQFVKRFCKKKRPS
ncbi:MAG TPA: tetratricopeptide repeat protein [Ktedonobacteraceae bacterium]